jgi:hypothetical protein
MMVRIALLSSQNIANILGNSIDLIPYMVLEDKYRSSHSSTVFFWTCVVCPASYFCQEIIEFRWSQTQEFTVKTLMLLDIF